MRISRSPVKPLLVYDGDCGFCRKWIARWKVLTRGRVDYEPYQTAAKNFLEIPVERFVKAVQLIEPDGTVTQAARAVFKSLSNVPLLGWLPWSYDHLPGFALLSEKAYAFVADHRGFFSTVDSCGLSQADNRPSYFFSRWLFLKVLALSYFTAFGALWFQVTGLIGDSGILPVHSFLNQVGDQLGLKGVLVCPSLCWLNDSNGFLRFLCGGGVVLSVLLFLDLVPVFCLFLLWLFYLSLVSMGQDFLSFQWDCLLLESGFLAIFLVSFTSRVGRKADASSPAIILFLFQWLLFRLMFCSGLVKLESGDPQWRHLTALHYHYETQPLPTPISWVMNQLPDWLQRASCFYLFGVELIVPFFIFGPRRLRPFAFGLMVSLQVLIALTGNYCFFNLLALGLCLFALEDEAWPQWFKGGWKKTPKSKSPISAHWPNWVLGIVFFVVVYMSSFLMTYTLGGRFRWPVPLIAFYEIMEPLRLVNSYGLFAVMTTDRPEISVEGSNDGKEWKVYEFKWKAGDLREGPHWVAPYQPRLDWQMWFAALGDYRQNPWFVDFLIRLLQGSPDVWGLLKTNPFPEAPPKYIRAELYNYHFSNFQEKSKSGEWWKREYRGHYLPAFSLNQVRSQPSL